MKRKQRNLVAATVAAASMLTSLGVWADTLYVDAAKGSDAPEYGYAQATPVKTIQRAIDMANAEGSTIVVAPGIYAPFNAMGRKSITIKSTDGAAKTIVDRQGKERCATFGNSGTMIIEGFTLKNGHATKDSLGNYPKHGGGVYYATVKNCIISGCVADGNGGGAHGCAIYDTIISECTAHDEGGGMSYGGAKNCIIFNNTSYGNGGGVSGGNMVGHVLISCVVSNNVASGQGGGILFHGSEVKNTIICHNKASEGGGAYTVGGTFRDCDIYGNEATVRGGGLSGLSWDGGRSYATFYNCDIHDNRAVRGGGIWFERLYGCRVYGNVATFGGGGYSLWAFDSIIEGNRAEKNGGGVLGGALYNCTVIKNTAGNDGGGVYTAESYRDYDLLSVSCYNTIVYGNTAEVNNDSADGFLGKWYYSCVGYLHDDLETIKIGVLYRDPKFVDTGKGNYRLSETSPCIDKGDNAKVGTDTDYAGMERIYNGTVDIGAYEFGASVKKFKVTFSADVYYATLKETSRDVEKGKAVGTLPNVVVATEDEYLGGVVYHCVFKGWFTQKYGGNLVSADTIITSDVTFYAQFEWVEQVVDGGTVGGGSGTTSGGSGTTSSGSGAAGGGAGTEVSRRLYGSSAYVYGTVPAVGATYDGYLYRGGTVVGMIQVKVGRLDKDGMAAVKATVIQEDGKKIFLKAAGNGKVQISAGGSTVVSFESGYGAVTLGAEGMSGTYGAYDVDGASNVFTSKVGTDKAVAAAVLGRWQGAVNVAWESAQGWNGLTVNIAGKGRANVSGTLADGDKVSAQSQLIVGDEWCCVPVVDAKKGARLLFTLWLSRTGAALPSVVGLGDNVKVGKPGSLKPGAAFKVDATLGDAHFAAYLPNGVAVAGGAKWTLPKAGKVIYVKGTSAVDESALGENPSALKLSYKAKDGTFKGSFKVYSDVGGKLKATTVTVTGVRVNGVGYGSATIKKVSSVPVRVE